MITPCKDAIGRHLGYSNFIYTTKHTGVENANTSQDSKRRLAHH